MLNQQQQINEQIKKAENILITFNKIWNGDAIASALAMYLFLKKIGKKVAVAAERFEPGKNYAFLPAFGDIRHDIDSLSQFVITLDLANAKVDKVKYQTEDAALKFIITPKEGFFTPDDVRAGASGFNYDLIIALDTPDLESLGMIYDRHMEFFYQVPIINIDHHADNEEYGQINAVELTAVATAEIAFNIIDAYESDVIDEDMATCLLCGIISKTRSFKTHNLTPQSLTASSRLIAMGARREEIVNRLYRSRSLNILKLWGRVLARLTSDLDNKLVWSVLTSLDFEKTGSNEEDLAEVVDELIVNIPDAKVIVLIHETAAARSASAQNGEAGSSAARATKAHVYAMKNINALNLVRPFNPAGTKSLARITVPKELAEAEGDIIAAIKENLSKLPF